MALETVPLTEALSIHAPASREGGILFPVRLSADAVAAEPDER